ncbi:MAG: pentapeptide repeat-containing protein [Clostridia bacterium]|nr:pentapeptide repeat-containing protein [Clostridia bacterium]
MKSYSDRTFKEIVKENEVIAKLEFTDCVFENCRFTECMFEDCNFCECKFVNCSLVSVDARDTGMLFSSFSNCTLVGLQWNHFQSGSVSFPVQKFEKCNLKYNSFEKMNFKKFDFMQSEITVGTFIGCNLCESSFKNCNLKDTEFIDCDLRKSDFRKASGYKIDLTGNRAYGAKFSYPDAVSLLSSFGIIIER